MRRRDVIGLLATAVPTLASPRGAGRLCSRTPSASPAKSYSRHVKSRCSSSASFATGKHRSRASATAPATQTRRLGLTPEAGPPDDPFVSITPEAFTAWLKANPLLFAPGQRFHSLPSERAGRMMEGRDFNGSAPPNAKTGAVIVGLSD